MNPVLIERLTYSYKYVMDGKKYEVSNFYVTDSFYPEMVHLSFEKAVKYNKSELIEE